MPRTSHLTDEIDEHDRVLKALLDQAAPQLLAERGIGYITAAECYLAWSHPGRCRNEAAYGRLGGTAPSKPPPDTAKRVIDSTVAATKAYIARRTAEGISERFAIRCSNRYIARRVWRHLEHPESALAP